MLTALATPIGALAQTAPALVTRDTLATVASSTLSTPQASYWQGEVFPVTQTVVVEKRLYQTLGGGYVWPTSDFTFEDWPRPTSSEADGRITLTQTTRAIAAKSGDLKLPAGTQPLTLITRINESTFGNQTETDTFTLTSKTREITIKPLPTPAPVAFSGAVGEFALASTATTLSVGVGESVTWSLKLTGTGNWPEIRALPARAVAKEFEFVKPVVKRAAKPDALFDGEITEELLLVPTKPGTYQLGPVRFVYFNPKDGKYQMLTSETITLTVGAATGAAAATLPPSGERTRVPDAPPALPLDPLASGNDGLAPFSVSKVFWLCLIAPIGFVLYWLRLAARRRWLTDSLHARRAAREHIVAILEELKGETPPTGAALRERFFAWQKASAVFAGVSSSAPTGPQIGHALAEISPGAKADTWAELFDGSNRVIFAQVPKIPAGWVARARAAVQETPLPTVPVHRLFLRRNLFPAVAALAVLFALPEPAQAADADVAATAYRNGDFAGAEKTWEAASAQQPTDAALRYNLALATAQQDRWSESAVQSLAAFCLDPSSQPIQWQLRLSLDRSGIDHPLYSGLAHGTGFYRVARWFSPAGWGALAVTASVVLSLGLGWIAFISFHGRFASLRWLGWSGAGVAVVALLGAFIGLRSYGQLAQRDIAVVNQPTLLASVPTEADTGQKTSALPAGSLARVDGKFLTWSHVVFANGQTGWVQTKLITHLYTSPRNTTKLPIAD